MKCVSAQNLLNAVSPTPKLSHSLGDSGHSNNHLQLRHLDNKKNSENSSGTRHKSLTRTRSAPLKESKDDEKGILLSNYFGQHHNVC